jgi:glucan phosphoethanolaminetransferase (alkaline phosphatase superfamily)
MPRAARSFFVLLASEVLVSASIINYFCRSFEVSRALILVHALVLTGVLLAVYVPASILLMRFGPARRWVRIAVVSLPAIVTTLLVLLYISDFASNRWMGSNVTYKLVGLWAADWRAGGNLLSVPPWVYGAVLAFAGVLLAVHVPLAATIVGGLSSLVRPDQEGSWTSTRRRAALSGVALVIVLAAYGIWIHELSWRTPRSELLSSDPVLAFFRKTVDVYDDSYLAIAAGLAASEPQVRAAYPKAMKFDRRNVIVIIVDSLRADHMSLYGYARPTTPFLSSLEAAGTLKKVQFATSTCAESNCGILSTLFSKTLRYQVPQDFKLYDLLKDQGYSTNFVLSGSHDWHDLREMYGFEHTLYFDGQQSRRFSRSDDRVIFEGLERVPDAVAPSFFYFHLMSVHLIGTKLERYRVFQPSSVRNDWDALFGGAYDQATVINNYDNGVVQADATIKALFDALDHKGYLKNSVVVILSDHGEGLGDRRPGEYGHVSALYQEFIRIPMLIYDDSPFDYGPLPFGTQIDVAPTILERLGLPAPTSWQGTSLMHPQADALTVHQTTLKTPCYAMVYRQDPKIFKYMYCFLGRREELYELGGDPAERNNLINTADAAMVDMFRRRLTEIRTSSTLPAGPVSPSRR